MANLTRTQFLALGGGALAGAALGAFYRRRESVTIPSVAEFLVAGRIRLRPPGAAADDARFRSACIRCGQCVEVCPTDTLKLADLSSGLQAGTPYFIANEMPCNLCAGQSEMKCIAACPTNALQPLAAEEDVRIGVAVVLTETCWAYNGISCRHCWHACPWPGEAVKYDDQMRPVVDAELCVGCGLCEAACPMEEKAIVVEATATRLNRAGSIGAGGNGG